MVDKSKMRRINFNELLWHLWACEQLGHIFSCDFMLFKVHITVSFKSYTGMGNSRLECPVNVIVYLQMLKNIIR